MENEQEYYDQEPKKREKRNSWVIKLFFWMFIMAALGGLALAGLIAYYEQDLPSTTDLENYHPKTATRLFDAKGELLAEYAEERRVYVPISNIPDLVKNAFIASEDQNFYRHSGVDIWSIARAMIQNAKTKISGSGGISGGSTITQQVVKNILLTNEKSLERKIKEAILAVRVTSVMSKDKILEVYLNEIFLGNRSYGVVAAANNYFGKSLDELTPEEAATLAGLPKAPSEFDPRRNEKRAIQRRNYVLERMADDDYITKAQYEKAVKEPMKLSNQNRRSLLNNYFAEEVRRYLDTTFGKKELYEGGMTVHTTVDPKLQEYAEEAMFNGITLYDRMHGFRGPVGKVNNLGGWQAELKAIKKPDQIGPFKMAVVLEIEAKKVKIGLDDGKTSTIPYLEFQWAMKWLKGQNTGPIPTSGKQVFNLGDVVLVSRVKTKDKEGKEKLEDFYRLEQIPDVNGAFVAMDPHSGRILAMVGGYPHGNSQFNRATQAKRQPGSAFKPFVYLTGLENGFTPATPINDGPISIPQGEGLPMWTPKNYSNDFLGTVPMRKGLEKSRNNMTILLALMLGVDKVQEMAKRMGILDNPEPYYSMVLGAQETTLMRLMRAYGALANGGKEVQPVLIDRIHDRTGKIVFRGDARDCDGCRNLNSPLPPEIVDSRRRLVDPVSNYLLVDIMQGVIERGTATRAKVLGRPIAGKTGTTNDSFDAWFVGFTPDIVVGTYMGFDNPKNMGKDSTGASRSLPVFVEFMQHAMKDVPPKPFKIPNGVRFQKIDTRTGQPADDDTDEEYIKMEILNPEGKQIEYSQSYKDYLATRGAGSESDGGDDNGGFGGADGSIDSGIYQFLVSVVSLSLAETETLNCN